MTPPKAALICEENPQCGGFTYKVREPIKYYAAEFLRKEQMGIPNSATCFLSKNAAERGIQQLPLCGFFLPKKQVAELGVPICSLRKHLAA